MRSPGRPGTPSAIANGGNGNASGARATGVDDAIGALGRGSRVWYRQDATTWILAELREPLPAADSTTAAGADGRAGSLAHAAPAAVVTLLSGPTAGRVLEGVPASSLLPANPDLQAAIPDLTQLSFLNEPSILGNLQLRYSADQIYTCAGPVLIALNPCKELPLYTPEIQHEYRAVAHESLHALPPHVYMVAGAAYRAMVREGASQSIVINGESGAGKTETTKRAMRFLASLAGGPGRIEERVLETNPVLEAFGNAKTLRNHNSSRFGKLVEIHFNATHQICGARIRTYLLEKSRVARRLPGERSFHIFYQLVRGADEALRAALRLPARPQDFQYLAQSGCLDIAGVDDAKDFGEVKAALADIGISPDHQNALFALLSGVLWLGNLEFVAVTDDSSRVATSCDGSGGALEAAAEMLGVGKDALAHALTNKKIRARNDLIVKPLNADEAAEARNALAKAVYAGVFKWVVSRINESLDTGRRGTGQFIAILDIYGFEAFDTNSFEQLCINYANEALQQQFTRHLFTLEQEEYMAEGVDWTKVEWTDNSACLEAIDAMPPRGLGVLAVLDSQCKFPKASDETFVTALRDAMGANEIFATDPRHPDQFLLRHYAGPVAYSAPGFLDKNKDALNPDLLGIVSDSDSWLLSNIGASLSEVASADGAANPGGNLGGGSGANATVSGRFGRQLRELLATLDATGLHFVRCVKPNAALAAGAFCPELVLGQLRCCGVLEVARVSRAGFPTRYPHAVFVERYRLMLPRDQQAALAAAPGARGGGGGGGGGGGAVVAVAAVLRAFGVKEGQFAIGHTKVFFRPGVLGFVEDRWARTQQAALRIQAAARMRSARDAFLCARAAAATLQSGWRARGARVAHAHAVRQHRAAALIQACWRGAAARALLRRARAAAATIQAAERRRALRARVAARERARAAADASAAAAAEEARLREASFDALQRRYGAASLEDVGAALACWGSLRDEAGAQRDPADISAALSLYTAVQSLEGGPPGGDGQGRRPAARGPGGDAAAVAAALRLAGAARARGLADEAALAEALDIAEAARHALGPDGSDAARVRALLREFAGTPRGSPRAGHKLGADGAGSRPPGVAQAPAGDEADRLDAAAAAAAGGCIVHQVEAATLQQEQRQTGDERQQEWQQERQQGGYVSGEEVEALRQQLERERAAKRLYAQRLEQQAVEWIDQVRCLQGYIDHLKTNMQPLQHHNNHHNHYYHHQHEQQHEQQYEQQQQEEEEQQQQQLWRLSAAGSGGGDSVTSPHTPLVVARTASSALLDRGELACGYAAAAEAAARRQLQLQEQQHEQQLGALSPRARGVSLREAAAVAVADHNAQLMAEVSAARAEAAAAAAGAAPAGAGRLLAADRLRGADLGALRSGLQPQKGKGGLMGRLRNAAGRAPLAPGQIDLSTMPDLAAPGLLDEFGARSGGGVGGGSGGGKKKLGGFLFGTRA